MTPLPLTTFEPRLDPSEPDPILARRLESHDRNRYQFLVLLAAATRVLDKWQISGIDQGILEQLLDAAKALAQRVEPHLY